MKDLLVGTRNEGKIQELHQLFSDFSISVKPLSYFDNAPFVVEDRGTFSGNAIKKARTFQGYTGFPTVSDDSGLEVRALDGKPGVKTARFAGDDASTDENIDLLLEKMKGVEDRIARFRTVLAFVDSKGEIVVFEGEIYGTITRKRQGYNGFGYDPIFCPCWHGKTFAEMDTDYKNEISHRREALEKFRSFFS